MKHEINISRKTINSIVLILIIAALLISAALILRIQPNLFSEIANRIQGVTPTISTDLPDARAAIAGVTAFYTLDYTIPVAQWETSVCATLTSQGCDVFKSLYAPGLRQIVEANQVRTSCTTKAIQVVDEKGNIRIWLLEATQDHPLQGTPATFQVYVEVAKDADYRWLMTHVLNNDEAARFGASMP